MADPEMVSMEVFSRAANASIVRLPWRRYPGVVVQGDTLRTMAATAERLATALVTHPSEDVRAASEELRDALFALNLHYLAATRDQG